MTYTLADEMEYRRTTPTGPLWLAAALPLVLFALIFVLSYV
jgi:hypothetical protein